MAFIKFIPPARHHSRTATTEPQITLMNNKGGRKLILNEPLLTATGLAKGDKLVMEWDDEVEGLTRIRRIDEGEQAFGLVTQSKNEKFASFTVGATILISQGFGPSKVTPIECSPGWFTFQRDTLPPYVPPAEEEKPLVEDIKPWPLKMSTKIAVQVARALVAQTPATTIARDHLCTAHEVEAVRKFVRPEAIAQLRTRSKPGQDQWFADAEERWAFQARATRDRELVV